MPDTVYKVPFSCFVAALDINTAYRKLGLLVQNKIRCKLDDILDCYSQLRPQSLLIDHVYSEECIVRMPPLLEKHSFKGVAVDNALQILNIVSNKFNTVSKMVMSNKNAPLGTAVGYNCGFLYDTYINDYSFESYISLAERNWTYFVADIFGKVYAKQVSYDKAMQIFHSLVEKVKSSKDNLFPGYNIYVQSYFNSCTQASWSWYDSDISERNRGAHCIGYYGFIFVGCAEVLLRGV